MKSLDLLNLMNSRCTKNSTAREQSIHGGGQNNDIVGPVSPDPDAPLSTTCVLGRVAQIADIVNDNDDDTKTWLLLENVLPFYRMWEL